MSANLTLDDFPLKTSDLIRFSDSDMVGHINNLAFVSYIETGRVEFLYTGEVDRLTPNANFVIVQMNLLFHREMNWPGKIEIGSAITRIGRSSIGMKQALFQDGVCTCSSDSTLVLMDRTERKSIPIPEEVIAILEQNSAEFAE